MLPSLLRKKTLMPWVQRNSALVMSADWLVERRSGKMIWLVAVTPTGWATATRKQLTIARSKRNGFMARRFHNISFFYETSSGLMVYPETSALRLSRGANGIIVAAAAP